MYPISDAFKDTYKLGARCKVQALQTQVTTLRVGEVE